MSVLDRKVSPGTALLIDAFGLVLSIINIILAANNDSTTLLVLSAAGLVLFLSLILIHAIIGSARRSRRYRL